MSLKIKLISCISLFMLMVGVLLIGVFAATQQQLTMEGSVSFNVPDKSLYVKDVRIKQDMASEPSSIDSFMPGYINGDFTLDLTGITDTNTYGSFSLYFDIINTTDIQWTIVDVELPTTLTNAGVSASYSGVVSVGSTTEDALITDATPIDGTLILKIYAPNANAENPVSLDGIVVTIDEYVPPVEISVYTNDEILGMPTGGGIVEIGQEVTLTADFTGNSEADFLGWKTSEEAEEFVSTLPDYTFTFEETSPTTYVAIFEEPDSHLTYTYNTPASGEAQLTSCSSGAIDIIVPSAIYRSSNSYNVTSMYDTYSFRSGVFYQAWSTLQSVSLPETITSIGSHAFYNCSGLTSITLPSSLKSIGYYAFYDCSGLTSITIPESVTSIGEDAFTNCSELETMNYLGTLESWCAIEFGLSTSNPTYYTHSLYIQEEEITGNVVVPEGIESLSCTFVNCENITSVSLPSSLESIGDSAFRDCSGLTSVIFEENSQLTSIGSGAFEGCSSLTSITLPSSLTSIGYGAFNSCSGLTSITIYATTPPTLSDYMIDAAYNINIYVPAESVEAYKSASGWSSYASKIFAIA